jgi:hypothetical protein
MFSKGDIVKITSQPYNEHSYKWKNKSGLVFDKSADLIFFVELFSNGLTGKGIWIQSKYLEKDLSIELLESKAMYQIRSKHDFT